jgi:pimeloyl-ACP methyl ester carboxylesterase
MARRMFYLHGFASSPQSTKAAYFSERLREYGIVLHCPDFNEPDFSTLTLTRMLERLDAEVAGDDEPAALIGSSLGGTVAILAAARRPAHFGRLVLLAPAVMFAKPGHHLLPPERVAEWRAARALPFFHYGENEERLLQFGFYEDALQYDAFDARFAQPTLIFQGLGDTSVDPRTVEQFSAVRPNVTLSLLEDDHQLTRSLPRMWADMEGFFDFV